MVENSSQIKAEGWGKADSQQPGVSAFEPNKDRPYDS